MSAIGDEPDVRYGRSPLTENWYKVTEWDTVEGDPDRIVANEKVEVDESEVPEEWRERMEDVGPSKNGGRS